MIKQILLGLAILACLAVPSAQTTNVNVSSNVVTNECIRWTWSGDVYNRQVVCLEWRKKDKEDKKKSKEGK